MMGILENQCKSGCFILWNAQSIFMLYNMTIKDSTFYQVLPVPKIWTHCQQWHLVNILKMQDEMKTKYETLAKFIKQNTQHKN